MPSNVFSGSTAIGNYLDPHQHDHLPLVELPHSLNPYYADGVRIFAKMLHALPLQNVKAIPAYHMLNKAKQDGRLDHIHTLVESSSGNTVLSLAVIGKALGISKTKALVSHEVSQGKLQLLRFFGVEIEVYRDPICPDANDPNSSIARAVEQGKQLGWFNPAQYHNSNNPDSHYTLTGPQIWEQTAGEIGVFCAGAGTTGTFVGTSQFLKEKNNAIKCVAVVRAPNNPVPGVRTQNLLRETTFEWRPLVDSLEEIGTHDAYEKSLLLSRNGLVVGPSSGFNLSGLIQFFQKMKENNALDSLRNKKGEIIAAFICCDTPFPYLNEYFSILDEAHFPATENEQLLTHEMPKTLLHHAHNASVDLSPAAAYHLSYSQAPSLMWDQLENEQEIKPKEGTLLVDLRSAIEFGDYHLPGSISLQMNNISLEELALSFDQKRLIAICQYGDKSHYLAEELRKYGIEAYNLKGGLIEWSKLGLPRWRAKICTPNKH